MSKNQIDPENRKAYFVGGGIASFAGAVFLIRDGKVPAKNIKIYEKAKLLGGSLDGAGDVQKGYVIRGGRMLNFSYVCTYDLLSEIPTLNDSKLSVTDEIRQFTEKVKGHSQARLVDKDAKILDSTQLGFSEKDRLQLIELMALPEALLGRKTITDWFNPDFFKSNFWYMWASMFAFEPWHSLVEFKRYCLRFVHEIKRIDTLAGVDRTVYNQYDSIVLPMKKWLQEKGVQFVLDTEVSDIDFKNQDHDHFVAEKIYFKQSGVDKIQDVDPTDLVFVTNGSMTANSTLGTNDKPARLNVENKDGAWLLWQKLAMKRDGFGHPDNFYTRINESKWQSFTVTNKGKLFFELMQKFSGNKAGTGGLVTFKDSSWMMSVVLAHQPHFIGQPEDVTVFWGYALFPDKVGDHIQKKMSDCTGAEIMAELIHHLKFDQYQEELLAQANCIPCLLPFITAQFLTREKTDRPLVIPKGSNNFSFLGQFAEVPDDVVFTVEYSVRTAQMAVYEFLKLDKRPPEMYKGSHDVRVMYEALKALHS